MNDARRYPDRPFLAASVAVMREGKVLLAARARPPLDGIFSLPGGLVEPGETLAEAALRELGEEVGIQAEIVGLIGPVEFIERDPDGGVRHHFVICAHLGRWIAGEGTTGAEALEVRWVAAHEIVTFHTTPGLLPILERAFQLSGTGEILPSTGVNDKVTKPNELLTSS